MMSTKQKRQISERKRKWWASRTQEQRAEVRKLMSERGKEHYARTRAIQERRVIAINLHLRNGSGYVRGSSQTLVLRNCPWEVTEVLDKLEHFFREVLHEKPPKTRTRTRVLEMA